MTLTERDVRIMQSLYWRGSLPTAEIHDEFFPTDKGGRRARRRLGELKDAGFVYARLAIIGERWNQKAVTLWALKKAGRVLLESQEIQGDPPASMHWASPSMRALCCECREGNIPSNTGKESKQ